MQFKLLILNASSNVKISQFNVLSSFNGGTDVSNFSVHLIAFEQFHHLGFNFHMYQLILHVQNLSGDFSKTIKFTFR